MGDALARHDTAVQLLADQVMHRLADRLHPEVPAPKRVPVAIDALLAALLDGDDTLATAMVRQSHDGDTSLRHAYFDTLGPIARRLGLMWEADEISFLTHSLAMGRVFSIMRALRREAAGRTHNQRMGRNALFATAPGVEHTLGVSMAVDLFRERGWQVDLRIGGGHDTLAADAARSDYQVIGLSAGHENAVPSLMRLIPALRAACPKAKIVLSGQIVGAMPGIKERVGVDAALTGFDELFELFESYVAA